LHLRPRSGPAARFSDAPLFGRTVLTVVVDAADRGRGRVAAIDRCGGRGFCRRGPIATRPAVAAVFAPPARHPDSRRRVGRTDAVASGRRAERFLGVLYFHDGFRRGGIRVLTVRDREYIRSSLGKIFKYYEPATGRRYFPDGYRARRSADILYSLEPDRDIRPPRPDELLRKRTARRRLQLYTAVPRLRKVARDAPRPPLRPGGANSPTRPHQPLKASASHMHVVVGVIVSIK